MNKIDNILTLINFFKKYKTYINGVLANVNDMMSLISKLTCYNLEYQTYCDGVTFEIEIEIY